MKIALTYLTAKNLKLRFLINLFVAYCLLITGLNLHIHVSAPYESGAYVSYLNSIVHDKDLNIINNIDSSLGWITSNSYNFPDMHDHGASLLWTPLLVLAEFVHKSINLSSVRLQGSSIAVSFEMVVVFIMNAFLGLMGLKIIRQLASTMVSVKLPTWTVVLVVFSTGFFNFLMYQFSTSDITLFFYASFITYLMSFIDDDWGVLDFLFLGSLFAFGSVIKITFPLLIPTYLFFYLRNTKFQTFDFLKKNIFFCLGCAIIYIVKEANELIKFGFINIDQGYSYSYNLENLLSAIPHARPFFGPAGLFVVSPISFFTTLALVGFAVLVIRPRHAMGREIYFFLSLGISFLAKHIINLTAIFDGYAGFGSRQYMVDTIVIYMMIAIIYKNKDEYRRFYKFSIIVLSLCLVLTSIEYLWWLGVTTYPQAVFNAYYIQDFSVILNQLKNMLLNLFLVFKNLPEHLSNNYYYVLLLIVPVWLWTNLERLMFRIDKTNLKLLSRWVGIAVIVFYTSVTAMNLYFNPRNVAEMKKHNFFAKKVVGNGKEVYLYDEYMSSIIYAMEIAKYNKNPEWFEYQKSVLKKLLEKSKAQIVVDPIGFKSQLDFGNLKNVEVDLHSADLNTALDYNSPTPFDNGGK